MQREAMLTQLGYAPNNALVKQLTGIEKNTKGYEKIQKHIMDLHDHLLVNNSYIALSNSHEYFKIKIESKTEELSKEAHEKVEHFRDKFKVDIKQLDNKNTYYIIGFNQ